MPVVLKKLADSKEIAVPQDGTLLKFATDNVDAALGAPDKRVELLVQLNWGTKAPREVARAMAETLGLQLKDSPDLDDFDDLSKLSDKTLKPDGEVKLRIPELWEQADVETAKDKKIAVRKARAANVVSIAKLSRWFVPEAEKCDIDWRIGGRAATADKLALEVYGSNYSDFKDWSDDLGTWTESADLKKTPIWRQDAVAHKERERKTLEWTGESNAEAGALKPGSGPGKPHVNAAFSPYTAMMRYYKNDGDKKARIELEPFWPLWDKDDKLVADSLKIKWKLHDGGGKLKQGLLTIVDGKDRPVFRKGLKAADLTDGAHEFDWTQGKYADGVTHDGKSAVDPAHAPYRVMIEAHRPAHEDEGLALAAMHSEVRIWVHPKTLRAEKDPYKALEDFSSMLFSVADLNHRTEDPDKDADENLWLRWRLSQAGFFAGPVKDAAPEDHLKRALADIKRSVPKLRPGGTGDFVRIAEVDKPTTHLDDVKAVIAAMHDDTDGYKRYLRPWFARADDPKRPDFKDPYADEVRDLLGDPTKEMIVWVDDRHFYTTATWAAKYAPSGHAPALLDALEQHTATPKPQRGGWMDPNDVKIDYDARDMLPNWIPIQAQPLLMKKDRDLDDESDYIAAVKGDDKLLKAMRKAVGPVRMDWSFDEIDGDYVDSDLDADGVGVKDAQLDPAMWGQRSRTGPAVTWTLDKEGEKKYARKDVKREANYHNAPVKVGGIRPATAADYYKAPFGKTSDSDGHLIPWKTKENSTHETIVTAVHDDLGPNHAEDAKFAKRRGLSGVYFTPSRMGGDGYRLRAQIRFDDKGGWSFPNREVLEKRYPRLPQSHSAGLRLWRKSTVRAYVQWSKFTHFASGFDTFRQQFTLGHVHYVSELDGSATPPAMRPSELFPAPTGGGLNAAYLDMAVKSVNAGAPAADPASMAFSDDYVFPWHKDASLSQRTPVLNAANPGSAAWDICTKNEVNNTYKAFSINVAMGVVDAIEKKTGMFRGNVILEMTVSDTLRYMNYTCEGCGQTTLWLESAETASKTGTQCSQCASAKKRLLNAVTQMGVYKCGAGHVTRADEKGNGNAGGKYHNHSCPEHACGDWRAKQTIDAAEYKCDDCGYTDRFPHDGGDCIGDTCPRCAAGKLEPTGDCIGAQDYTCSGCSQTFSKPNPSKKRDECVGQAHVCTPATATTPAVTGTLAAATPANVVYDLSGVTASKNWVEPVGTTTEKHPTLPASSLGLPVGVSLNFKAKYYQRYECDKCSATFTVAEETRAGGYYVNKTHGACTHSPRGKLRALGGTEDTNPRLWAHEVSHNHSLSHAANAGGTPGRGSGSTGARPDEHDMAAIQLTPAFTAALATGGSWDRSCLMAYTSHFSDFDIAKDKQCMCFRCVLRTRGWKVTGLTTPPSARGGS